MLRVARWTVRSEIDSAGTSLKARVLISFIFFDFVLQTPVG